MARKRVLLTSQFVIEARRRARRGEPISEIARDTKASYTAVYNAVRGRSWQEMETEPPVPPPEPKRQHVCRNPSCGREYTGQPYTGLCRSCYEHHRINGEHRDPNARSVGYIHIPDLDDLYERYRAGETFDELAVDRPYTGALIRKRFLEAGYDTARKHGNYRVMTPAEVRQARVLVHEDGERIADVARRLGHNYNTVCAAVNGQNWRSAGGPLPEWDGENTCARCGVLTDGELCAFCRSEGHANGHH